MDCKGSRPYYYGFLKDKASVPGEAAVHLESCTECREQMRRLSGELSAQSVAPDDKSLLRRHLKLHAGLLDRWVSCRTVRPFMPAMLVDFMRVTAVTPVTVHIEHCATCEKDLRTIQQLELTQEELVAAAAFMADCGNTAGLRDDSRSVLQTISESAESGVETRMTACADNGVQAVQARPSSSVQVRYTRQETVRGRSRSLNYVLTGGVAAAAVILVAMLLPTAASGNLKKVNQIVNSVSNVHVLRYSHRNELIQELWVSRTLGFKLYRQPQNTMFKDLRSGQIMQAEPGDEPVYLDEGIREEDKYTKLLPFEHLKDLPRGYDWDFIGDDVLEDGRRVKVYELSWDTIASNLTIRRKWRGYLDADSYLPYRIEWLEKVSEEEFELFTTLIVSYPSETECLEQLKNEGFQRFLTEDQPE